MQFLFRQVGAVAASATGCAHLVWGSNRFLARFELPKGRRMDGLALRSEQRDGTTIVTVGGDLDIVTSPALDDCLSQARAGGTSVILDLSAVDFMDTSALAVIVGHWKKLEAAGGTLALAGARYRYTKTLWITGLADRLSLYDTVDAAVEAASPGSTR
jgi:anti-sigma B factor antagonist